MRSTLVALAVVLLAISCGRSKQPGADQQQAEGEHKGSGPKERNEAKEHDEAKERNEAKENDEAKGRKESNEHDEAKGAHDGSGSKEHDEANEHEAKGTHLRLKTDDAAKIAGFEIVKALDRPEGAGLVAIATIAFDATKRGIVNARAPGIVRSIKVDVGAKVERGTALAVIESSQVGVDRSRLGGAQARVQVAEASYKREAELQAKGISAMKDLLAAHQELEAAKSEYQSLTATLGAVGGNAGGTGYTLASPLAGTVVRRAASIGKLVGVEETLFEVVDTSVMWTEIDVPEDQLASIAIHQPVIVTVDGLGDRQFNGTISYLSPEVDARTRTARARAALLNPDGVLRANMFARARIIVGGGKPTVTVPSKAVQRINDSSIVFVRVSDREFDAREVELGADDGAIVEITSGLRGGDAVVAQGAFLLKSEMLKASLKGDDD
jgi:cobalt-zinc-cadmium efflux system membrane fusion protein